MKENKPKVKDSEEEIWKEIEGWDGKYSISNRGNIMKKPVPVIDCLGRKRVVKGRLLKQITNTYGYKIVMLCTSGDDQVVRMVHRLIAEAFIPNPENKPQVNHINCKKDDNSIANLEWATREENMQHAHDNGLMKVKRGSASNLSKLKETDIVNIRKLHTEGMMRKDIAKLYNCKLETIAYIVRRITWKHVA